MADKIVSLSTGICEVSAGWAPKEICVVQYQSFSKRDGWQMGGWGGGATAELRPGRRWSHY